MRIRCGIVAVLTLLSAAILAAPSLSTIEDVLYKADGTRFNGVAFVEWKSFQAADFSSIATHSVTVKIVNGVIRVSLVPTTNASPGAYYSVRYNSDGRIQFDEIWAVPPSAVPLKLRDVRVALPSGGGPVVPPPGETTIQESDVEGLVEDLEIRPLKGPGFAPSRAVYISETGTLEAVEGNLGDCVRVDGTAGPCGVETGAGPGFVDAETPDGLVDGVNVTFTLADVPSPPTSLTLYRNGVLQKDGVDFVLTDNVISFLTASVPQPGDILVCSYRRTSTGAQTMTLPQVICSSTGSSSSSTTLASLGTCSIAADFLQAGDRVDVRFSYSHEGVQQGFTFEIHWGSATIVSRSGGATDSRVAGYAEFGIHLAGAQWNTQSWGSVLALAAGIGNAEESLSAPLVIDLLGKMAESTTDTITLRNFTVVRYPAHANP
jgi:hypothetical protein